jgi:hypothetical protein
VKLSIFGGPLFFLLDERVGLSKGGLRMVTILRTVFHLHIDRDSNWLRQINGRADMGVAAVRFFHSQCVRLAQGQAPWRVQGRGERATRDGFNC